MSSIESLKNQKSRWLLVAPVSGLVLTTVVNEEITINNITFVSSTRLPYVRKRLGFPITINELKKNRWEKVFFEKNSVYAIGTFGGAGFKTEEEFLKSVKDELSIISLSQLGWGRRRNNACLTISSEKSTGHLHYLMINVIKKSWMMHSEWTGRHGDLWLDSRWHNYHKFSFFYELIEVLKGNIKISEGWKCDIKNAALLAGESQATSDLTHAFLWNMIAIETLLTHQGDSYSSALPKRVEAFIGWTTDWALNDYENKIKEVYRKRCVFVHAGRSDEILIEDLLFTDNILNNIFRNILKHMDIFKSKEDLIGFSLKVEAEHVLGIKSKIRPKTVSFSKMIYNDKDYEKI
ncbi:hypothetical protein [Vreelandella aquamarina]|uniref:Apea-like HEPN domain-containing protein n=1 Tax=Vreelandella aquamarina TaxID=77097 RepID=A0A1H8P029_9GAMM|nr:hypothetical protein [Halomonas aquamarina]SEO34928.1 hypothetical protein SAMN04490369_107411 [Halomonas aquamarina]